MSEKALKIITIFAVGALCYGSMEIINRGFTHISMGILGGLSFLVIHILNGDYRNGNIRMITLLIISALFITSAEFFTGELLNHILGMNIWSYSDMPLNIDGQICLPFTIIWFVLSVLGVITDNFIRHKIFNEHTAEITAEIAAV